LTPSATEIEAIVRNVLGTLMAGDMSVVGGNGNSGGSVKPNVAIEPTPSAAELILTHSLISTRDLIGRLKGMHTVRVPESAVITPAVRDLCREAKVTIVRGTQQTTKSSSSSSKPQRLIVAGSTNSIASIAKQLCPRQANVLEASADDTSALSNIANGLRNGHQAGVLVAKSPFSACWQAARDEKLRPVVVGQWSDLAIAVKEVPTNLLILGADRWNVPSACNAARFLFEHLKRNS
jgi:hypothetical protein